MKIVGMLVDIHLRDIYPAEITVSEGIIKRITRVNNAPERFIMPGLIDAHIHIESSMITPGAFAIAAVKHGTTGVVSDPHEIANVLGLNGINYMLEDSLKVPLHFWFGAPSCVPATNFETNGGILNTDEIGILMKNRRIKYLSEMMNFPGVINGDDGVLAKIEIAKSIGKPIDGHAPGLTGERLKKYVSAGISTDHECSSLDEAFEKIALGMKILVREGSAARNLDSLKELYNTDPQMLMLCSDDLNAEMLSESHINKLIGKLITEGYDVFDVIRSATINPVIHYKLEAGLLQPEDIADFIVVDNLKQMNIIETWIEGQQVYAGGKVLFEYRRGKPVNNFCCLPIKESDIRIEKKGEKIRVIEALDGGLGTRELIKYSGKDYLIGSDIERDILKIIVKDRYKDSPPAVAFIKGFGLKKGAFASSIAHDSHNIICIGTNDMDIMASMNEIIKNRGGLSVSTGEILESLQLDIGGIMTTRPCNEVAKDYKKLNKMVTNLGCSMAAPFMALSFMALLVIPDLKIGDRGLFDVNKFELVPLFVE